MTEAKEYRDPINRYDVSKKKIVDQMEKDIISLRDSGKQVKVRMKLEKEYIELVGKRLNTTHTVKIIAPQPRKCYELH
jgi:hypothetical protein